MRVTLESTEQLVTLNGVPARVWEGETASGVRVHALIARVGVSAAESPATLEQFAAELVECRPPSREVREAYGIDPRLIL